MAMGAAFRLARELNDLGLVIGRSSGDLTSAKSSAANRTQRKRDDLMEAQNNSFRIQMPAIRASLLFGR
jgi:hypothetical protein